MNSSFSWSTLFNETTEPVRRKVFISHYHRHQVETDAFLRDFGDVFIRKSVGAWDDDNLINSHNPEYVMQRIRSEYIGDSTATIVLVGPCTHSRRYIDWEIKGSLQRSGDGKPNGLLAIQYPSCSQSGAYLPQRFEKNWSSGNDNCYAKYYRYPQSKDELRQWIEDAYIARTTRAHLIRNSHDTMMTSNARCRICQVTH
jgi:hypothetical protein